MVGLAVGGDEEAMGMAGGREEPEVFGGDMAWRGGIWRGVCEDVLRGGGGIVTILVQRFKRISLIILRLRYW